MFAVATFRSLNRPSGTSGESTRDSITRKTPRRTAAAARRPSVCVDVQPASLPLTIAYTASMSAAVTVTAPATSSFCSEAPPRAVGSSLSEAT